ncbi:carboxypeptidase B-like [Onthophagus taurus]|uniref:carboxypeptidase B-like n=1 Tax=Onthophagus taurus TaxID=166361 RepID=UPI000C20C52D|nr:carboxypeptidase B-like [Onthophagus taurus]
MLRFSLFLALFSLTLCFTVNNELKVAEIDYEEIKEIEKDNKNVSLSKVYQEENEEEKISYDGYQVWKVSFNSNTTKVIKKIRDNYGVRLWGGNRTKIDVVIPPKNLESVQKLLKKNLIDFNVMIEDLQSDIEKENIHSEEEEDEFQHRYGHRMTFTSYHRLSDIHNYLDYLAETYPSYCKVYVIGSSIEGRPLKLLKISNGNANNKAIWIDGGIHAREWITPATVSFIIDHLVHNIESESKNLQNLDYYIIPVLNPDGYEYSHGRDRLWRKNRARGSSSFFNGFQCAGTDLNRNYGYKWGGKGSGKNPCQEIYAGSGPFSEPETAAVKKFISNTKANWKASISYHSYGQYILFPWGYEKLITTDYQDLNKVAQDVANAIKKETGATYTYGPAGNTLYPASGGSDDWAKGAMGIKYAYTIELRDNGRYGFVLPASYIVPSAKEGLAALRVIAEAAANS